jgi:small-conductance mechanosensitive channel
MPLSARVRTWQLSWHDCRSITASMHDLHRMIFLVQTPAPQDIIADLPARLERYRTITQNWISGHWVEMITAIGLAILVYLLLSWLCHFAARFVEKSGNGSALSTIAARAVTRTTRFFRIMLALQIVNDLGNAPPPIARVISVLFTIALVIQIAIWLREIIIALIERRAENSGSERETLSNAMALIRIGVSFALFAIAAIVILDNLGINVTGLVAGLGVGGIAIGLAAQGIFSDLFAAISIIFDQPFRRGDTISYDTTTARVERIGMKSTRLRALSGEEKIISNAKLLEKEITNFTMTDFRRTNFTLGLVYHTPPVKAAALPALLQSMIEAEDAVFIRAGFAAFGPSSLDFSLVFDVSGDDFDHLANMRHRIGIAVMQLLSDHGYELAYPTQTTYTAAPDGTLVMPYAQPVNSAAVPRKPAGKQ